MKIAVFSDVHGNLRALKSALEMINDNKADEIIEAYRNHLDELIKNYESNLGKHAELCDNPDVNNTQDPNA